MRLPFRRRRPGAEHPPAPFVVGVGRSGTTLLRLMLDAHPRLAIPPETHFLPELIGAGGRRMSAAEAVDVIASVRQWNDFGFSREALEEALRADEPLGPADAIRGFYAAYAARHRKERWGDKTPIYVESMPVIAAALPEARFVHLIRDGRDVALSRSTWSEGEPPDPVKAARRWRRRIERAREDSRRVPHYLELRYEDLVEDPGAALGTVCEFVELEYDPAMLAYHERAEERLSELGDLPASRGKDHRSGEDRLAIHELTKEPPSRERIARWRTEMSPEDLRAYEGEAGDLLAELGYETGAAPRA